MVQQDHKDKTVHLMCYSLQLVAVQVVVVLVVLVVVLTEMEPVLEDQQLQIKET